MKSRVIRRRIIIGILSITICLSISAIVQAQAHLSERLLRVLAQSDNTMPIRAWVFVDSTAVSGQLTTLSERAWQRRVRVNPDDSLIDERDYAISTYAIEAVQGTGVRVCGVSRWLKAISVEVIPNQLDPLAALPFVAKIDMVRTFVNRTPDLIELQRENPSSVTAEDYDYAGSLPQNEFVGAVKLHHAGLTGNGVRIAMFDTGFNPDHEAFNSAQIVGTWDFVNDDPDVSEPDCVEDNPSRWQTNHGTITWGVIAGYLPGELIGVAPGAEFLLAQTEISCGGVEIKREEDNWILAAEWADSAGTDIISSSLGYYQFTDSGSYEFADLDGDTPLITHAADIAASKNILVVTAAGNMRNVSWGHILTPADGDSVIAVGAVALDSSLASFSSPGPTADGRIKPDITTLGSGVLTASHLGGLIASSGTSLSTPLVAGCAALALEHDPSLTAVELRDLIKQSGDRTASPDNDFGWGLFDAVKTADIVHFVIPEVVQVQHDRFVSVPVATGGRSPIVPELSAFDLPPTVSFYDNGDGTGQLDVLGSADMPPVSNIGLVADVGYFADTTYLTVVSLVGSQRSIFAGPNPFHDSIRIFIPPSSGLWTCATVFNVSGEKMWEKVNMSPSTSDVFITWYGCNEYGTNVASGVYIIRVSTDKLTTRVKALKLD
ncbi:MAG: S8 family peptidase [candidate division Zixibacteria bacterium]|nr:S8 family peptidase [candidate division Zixibacteria bacterium]